MILSTKLPRFLELLLLFPYLVEIGGVNKVINTHKLNTVMENKDNMIVEKTTIVKNAEPLTLKAVPFAKGYKVEVKLSMNPENTLDMDKVLLPLESSKLRQAVAGFIQFIEDETDKGGLGGNLLTDDDKAIKEATKGVK